MALTDEELVVIYLYFVELAAYPAVPLKTLAYTPAPEPTELPLAVSCKEFGL